VHNEDGEPYKSIGSIFKRACQRANLIGVTPHTLRHTFASRLVMAGVDLRTVQELGGWQTLSMVERYAHLSPAHKAQAVERIALVPSPAVDGLHVGANPEPVLGSSVVADEDGGKRFQE
jgi:integrase